MYWSFFTALLLFAMAALHCGISESVDFIEGNCNDVIRLPCKATDRTTTYRYVIWYKIEVSYLDGCICFCIIEMLVFVSLFYLNDFFLS